MYSHKEDQPDYGMGKKTLNIYLIGLISCAILTIISFSSVMLNTLTKAEIFTIIYASACIQFLVQLICFLRLNIHSQQAKMNVMSIVFTAVILTSIICGSLWIMWNCNYHMMF